ncbi:Zuotin [Zancudomyces culisetae]|uniref:Zuotin n=1 Tax=Zancudomyces culisetae TaxID=1213189 RepID=A0A1R1PX42_ZANCU|nr:Zuotin [Zancudomyces culisetae]|eukprot:OMH85550.1 Zuotin [Zancudomyces culisetae]
MSARLAIELPQVAAEFQGNKIHAELDGLVQCTVKRVGGYMEQYLKLVEEQEKGGNVIELFEEIQRQQEAKNKSKSKGKGKKGGDGDDEEETADLLLLKASEWRTQDHYKVLGLSKLRYRATTDDIIRQQRKKVLRHHPDKRIAQAGGVAEAANDELFKCIQKAFEILMDPIKRKQFDSVDPGIPDDEDPGDVPKKDFYKVFGPIFEKEGRFSKTQPAPKLGTAKSTKEEVEAFYDFFYNMKSWRSFEYLDEDPSENSDNRDNKRWAEKKNKNAREKRKKDDTARLRKILDSCARQDPRMAKFREEAKANRKKNQNKSALDLKQQKQQELQQIQQKQEEQKAAEEAEKQKNKEKELQQQEKESAKKEKEALKKVAKKEKKTMKTLIKDNNYLYGSDVQVTAENIAKRLDQLDAIFAGNKDADALVGARAALEKALTEGNAGEVFDQLAL